MYDFLSQLFAYNKGSASWNWFRWMKCRLLLKCFRLFSAGSLIRSVEQSLASHSDGLDLVYAVCAGFWKPFTLAYLRLCLFLMEMKNWIYWGDWCWNCCEIQYQRTLVSFICLIVYCLMEIKPSCSAVKSYFPSLLFPLEWCFVALSGLIALYISHQQYQKYQCYLL